MPSVVFHLESKLRQALWKKTLFQSSQLEMNASLDEALMGKGVDGIKELSRLLEAWAWFNLKDLVDFCSDNFAPSELPTKHPTRKQGPTMKQFQLLIATKLLAERVIPVSDDFDGAFL